MDDQGNSVNETNEGAEYIPRPRSIRSPKAAVSSRRAVGIPAIRSGRWLRVGFFAIAAAWGFGIGLTTLALGLAAAGRRAAFDVELLKAVLPGLVAAVAGGVVAAAAYREIRDRRRP